MPYQTPDRQQILDRIKTDFRVEVGADPLRRSVEYGLARAQMGQSAGQYGHQRWIFQQLFPDTAEEQYFWRWAGIYSVFQKPAQYWHGNITLTGIDGTLVPQSTVIVRSDGQQYTTDLAVNLSGATSVASTSVVAALVADLSVGQPLALGTPLTGVNTACLVTGLVSSAADPERAQDALPRLLLRLGNRPKGGGPGDYVGWALELPGATRAWESPRIAGPNTVGVSFVRDGDGVGALALPDSGERAEMLAWLETKVPTTVDVSVIELLAVTVDLTIKDLTPDTSDIRAAIALSLQDYFTRESQPGSNLPISRIDDAISDAAGEFSHELLIPTIAPSAANNQLLVLGTITYV
jgi:uncharacterized phage protein gp47/JayE